MEKIHIFWGSDKNFDKETVHVTERSSILDILDHINKTHIAVEGIPPADVPPLEINNLIMQTDDYGAIREWAILGFSNNILKHSRVNIHELWLNNPPNKFFSDLEKSYKEIIEITREDYQKLEYSDFSDIYKGFNERIIGQPNVITQILSSMYSLMNNNRKRPVTLLFIGESGVGKTETAKYLNSFYTGEMLRVQFSMQQTVDAYKYIFGAEHGEDSLARELIRRQTNVILLDEFDKVHSSFYNAFYQMFDEGIFVDKNYSVNIEKCIIICTSNYLTESEAEKHLGTPIYSRFSRVIRFESISVDNKIKIAKAKYKKIREELSDEDKELISDNEVLDFYCKKIEKGFYKNMRMLNNDIEDALNFQILQKRKIID